MQEIDFLPLIQELFVLHYRISNKECADDILDLIDMARNCLILVINKIETRKKS
jgi:hypothetical protein